MQLSSISYVFAANLFSPIWIIVSIQLPEGGGGTGGTFNKAQRNPYLDDSLYLMSTKLISILMHNVEIRHRNTNFKRYVGLLLNF